MSFSGLAQPGTGGGLLELSEASAFGLLDFLESAEPTIPRRPTTSFSPAIARSIPRRCGALFGIGCRSLRVCSICATALPICSMPRTALRCPVDFVYRGLDLARLFMMPESIERLVHFHLASAAFAIDSSSAARSLAACAQRCARLRLIGHHAIPGRLLPPRGLRRVQARMLVWNASLDHRMILEIFSLEALIRSSP
jgi:hypothetical protein